MPLLPALLLVGFLFGASVVYGVAQSLGYLSVIGQEQASLDAYRGLLIGGDSAGAEFWGSLGFSLWVSGASTLLAAAGALIVALLAQRRNLTGGLTALNLSLAFPHLVWAIALLLLLSQSGLLARVAAGLGLINMPAQFPVIVRDRYGFGIIVDYVSKEIPFLALIVLGILRSQPEACDQVAENLGATRLQRLRFVTLPLVFPGLAAGALLTFAFVFGAYEVPAVLGVRFPRMLSVLALDFFNSPDLRRRAEGMAVSVIMAAMIVIVAVVGRRLSARREL